MIFQKSEITLCQFTLIVRFAFPLSITTIYRRRSTSFTVVVLTFDILPKPGYSQPQQLDRFPMLYGKCRYRRSVIDDVECVFVPCVELLVIWVVTLLCRGDGTLQVEVDRFLGC